MTSARVLVIGNCTLDIAYRVPRFPRPGEDRAGRRLGARPRGKGANQAVVAARCGAPVAFCAAVGADENGVAMRARLVAEGRGYGPRRDSPRAHRRVRHLRHPRGGEQHRQHPRRRRVDGLRPRAAGARAAAAGDVLLMQGNLAHDPDAGVPGRRAEAADGHGPQPGAYPVRVRGDLAVRRLRDPERGGIRAPDGERRPRDRRATPARAGGEPRDRHLGCVRRAGSGRWIDPGDPGRAGGTRWTRPVPEMSSAASSPRDSREDSAPCPPRGARCGRQPSRSPATVPRTRFRAAPRSSGSWPEVRDEPGNA